MTSLSVVHDEWSAAVTDRLVARGMVGLVTVANADAQKAWGGHPRAKTVRLVTEATVTGGEREFVDVDSVLVWGLPSVPRWLSSATPGAAWYQVTAICQGGMVVSDPVHWCIRHGQSTFRLSLHRSGPDVSWGPVAVEVPVGLSGSGYADGVDEVADRVEQAMSEHRAGAAETRDPTVVDPTVADPATAADGTATMDPFPLDRSALRVDWSASADVVARHIRSGIGRMTPAWTYLKHFPVSIGAVELVDAAPCELPAGTIVRRDRAGVVVQTGSGMVHVAQVRDAVGVLPLKTLRPGLRFGIDPHEELRMLWRRVSDLERTVQWLSLRVVPPDEGAPVTPAPPPTDFPA